MQAEGSLLSLTNLRGLWSTWSELGGAVRDVVDVSSDGSLSGSIAFDMARRVARCGSLSGSMALDVARGVARCGRATCCVEELILNCFDDCGVVRVERHQVVAMHMIAKVMMHVYASQSPCMSELREN